MIGALGSILKKAAEIKVQEIKDTATKFFNADDEGKIKMLIESPKNSPHSAGVAGSQPGSVGVSQSEDAGANLARLHSMSQI